MRPNLLSLWVLSFVAAACSHTAPVPKAAVPAPTTAAQVIARDVQSRLAAAERLYRRGMYADAQNAFETLRNKFPYSPEAILAELREADLLFCQARYIEAAEAYKAFVRYHPRHREVGYAKAEAAESELAQIPKEWWFLPPVAEKDQQILRQTIEAYDDLIASGPTPRQAARAQQARAQCQIKLAQHELYVARFYVRRRAFAGAQARAEGLLARPQPPEVARAALWLAAQGAKGAGDASRALGHLRQLARDYPDSREAKLAQPQLRKSAAEAGKD